MGPYAPAEKSQLKAISTDVISTADKEIALHYKLKIFVNIKKKKHTRKQSKAMGIKLIYLWMNISLHWNQFDLFVNEHFPSMISIWSICEWTLLFTENNLICLWMNTFLHWNQFVIFVNEHFPSLKSIWSICEWTFFVTEINLIYLWMNTSRHWNQLDLFVSEHSPSLTSLWFICEWTFLVTGINSWQLFKVWNINT